MTDTDKLKRLARGMTARPDLGIKLSAEECQSYGDAILALIADNERLGVLVRAFNNGMPPMTNKDVVAQRDEAVALLRRASVFVDLCVDVGELHSDQSGEPTDMFDDISAFLARIDAAE